jgi:H+/Cl- antiporter ClcA
MPTSNLQNLFSFVWAGILLGWVGWFLVKLYQFEARTRLQATISKPQLYDLTKLLLTGTALVAILLFAPLILGGLVVPGSNVNVVELVQSLPLCFLALILFAFMGLGLQLIILKNLMNYPFTDKKVVPLPEPLPAPPYANKSFDQLSKELDESLKQLRE